MKHFFDWFLAIAAVSGNRSHIPAAVITLALLTPAVVLADPMLGTGVIHDPSESPTDGWKGSYVYYGTYDSRQVKYRVLNPFENAFTGSGYYSLLLDCDSTVETDWFGRDNDAKWDGSNAQRWLNNTFFNTLTPGEKAAIALSTKSRPSSFDGSGYGLLEWTPLDGDRIFLLDAMEATNSKYGYSSYSDTDNAETRVKKAQTPDVLSPWWLRSIGKEEKRYAGIVYYPTPLQPAGIIFAAQGSRIYGDGGNQQPPEKGISPAFNVKLSSIVFSHLISGTAGEYGAEYKLSLATDEITVVPSHLTITGTTVKIPYSVSVSGIDIDKVKVYAMAVSQEFSETNGWFNGASNASILSQTAGTPSSDDYSGTLELTLSNQSSSPDYILNWDDSFYIYLIAEIENGGKLTNDASLPLKVDRPEHVHNWVFTADNDHISATCDAPLHVGPTTDVLTIKPPDAAKPTDIEYNGTAYEAYLTTEGQNYNNIFNPDSCTIQYYQCSETDGTASEDDQCENPVLLENAPVNAGKYLAAVTVENKTARVQYRIYKAIAVVNIKDQTIATDETIQYGPEWADLSNVVEGHTLSAINLYADETQIKAVISDTKIADADGNDVTDNYVIMHHPGTLTIKPAYDLWVGGVQVTSANRNDILGDGTASFVGTAAGGTLVLSNAVITNAVVYESGFDNTAGIYAGFGFDLTISLDGSNHVANAREGGDGIRADGNLSLGGAGSLTVKGGADANGINAYGTLRIGGTTVAASSGSCGLYSYVSIMLTNATVSATGTNYGILASGSATFAGESRVEATATGSGGKAIYANDGITVRDGLGVALPPGGKKSDDGTTLTDAEGNTTAHALVAHLYTVTVTNGSPTNLLAAAGFDIDIAANDPAPGKTFVLWSSDVEELEFADPTATETTFTMPATDVAVTANFTDIAVTWADGTEYTYTGSAITPAFRVSLNEADLHVGDDYVASWADNVNVGTATLTVTLTNRPAGFQTNTFRIKPRTLTDNMVELTVPTAGWWTYNGEAPQPGFSLSDEIPGALTTSDIVVSWINNDAPGWATAVFAGTNNYTGRLEKPFLIVPAPRTFIVTAGKWGAVAVETNGVELATVGPGATTNLVVGYGSSVTATAVPSAGFAVLGGTNSFSFASFTADTSVTFSFVPNPAAELRWKFSSAVGRYFAQVMIPAHAGYDEALEGLAYIFADRTNNVGDVYAQLWNVSARGPANVLLTDNGVEYRGVTLGSASFAGKAEGERTIWGVADASFNESRNIVPAGERQIGLYVRKRVDPVSGNETAAEVENFLGYLTWTTDDTRWFLPVVEGGATLSPVSSIQYPVSNIHRPVFSTHSRSCRARTRRRR